MNLRSTLLALVVAVSAASSLAAQTVPTVSLPASPSGQAALQIGGAWTEANNTGRYEGGKWITVDYSRPLVRGRQPIFGSGADYGRTVSAGAPVWRAGANATTRLTTQAALQIGEATIQPGVYNVFVELKEGAWTLVLSTQPIQEKYNPNDKVNLFGAYNYDRSFDVLRAPMTVSTSPVAFEQFTIAFVDASSNGATLLMLWDTTAASVPFTTR